jgi:hypothetical protein
VIASATAKAASATVAQNEGNGYQGEDNRDLSWKMRGWSNLEIGSDYRHA